MLCIRKKVELDTGIVAATWVPSSLTYIDPETVEVVLAGKVLDDSPIYVHSLSVQIELKDVHLYKRLLGDINDELFASEDSPLCKAAPGDKHDTYRKKTVMTKRGIQASVWKRRRFTMNFQDDAVLAAYDGYTDKTALDQGVAPLTGNNSYSLHIRGLSGVRGFDPAQRQLLTSIIRTKRFELYGGRVVDVD